MKLIVGLGNPGAQFERTRHNVGFWSVRRLAALVGAPLRTVKFRAIVGEGRVGDERALFMLPQTFMNLSGDSVCQAVSFYKLAPGDVIVVHDDLDLPQGTIRVRRGGSAGGHNGIKSIIERCGDADFARVKIGIGRPPDSRIEPRDWVLAQCGGADLQILEEQCDLAAKAVAAIVTDGPDKAMNAFNGGAPPRSGTGNRRPPPEKPGEGGGPPPTWGSLGEL